MKILTIIECILRSQRVTSRLSTHSHAQPDHPGPLRAPIRGPVLPFAPASSSVSHHEIVNRDRQIILFCCPPGKEFE